MVYDGSARFRLKGIAANQMLYYYSQFVRTLPLAERASWPVPRDPFAQYCDLRVFGHWERDFVPAAAELGETTARKRRAAARRDRQRLLAHA